MSGTSFLPEFKNYVSLGLGNNWLGNNVEVSNGFGSLFVQDANVLKNGRFKITTVAIDTTLEPDVFTQNSGFVVYSSELAIPDATKATNGQLKTGDKIYYYNHNNQTHTLIGTVDTVFDGYYDDLKINFTSQVSDANVLALGQALQYSSSSLGMRDIYVRLYDTNGYPQITTVYDQPITLNTTGNGFNFDFYSRTAFLEDANGIAASSDITIAYAEKDALNAGNGNYNGTFLKISATSDSTAYMAAAGDLNNLESMSPEFFNALNKIFGLMLGDAQGQKLDIDSTGKSFTYDKTAQELKVGETSFASVSFGEMGTNLISIRFNNDLATTSLVNEVLQSITYQNTQDAPFPLSVIEWDLNVQTGVDTNNNPIINTLTSGQSLITVTPINDAPLLRPNLQTIGYTERFDFAEQTATAVAAQQGVYSSENTQVLSAIEMPVDFSEKTLAFLSNGAGVLVAEGGASTFTFTTPQSSVSLDFFNGIKAITNLSADDLAALGDSSEMLMMTGLPYRKVSFFNANNELLGVSEITDLDISSLSLFVSLMLSVQTGDNSSLPELSKLYNARFTAPQGETIASVKIEGIVTTLTTEIGNGTPFPVLLDSITFGEITTPSLNLPPLTAGQSTEFVVGEMISTGTIVDPDIFPWDSQTTPKAIAVSTVDTLQGEWKYKIGSGNWTTFDFADNTGKALLLSESDSLQFTPNQNFNGILNNAITFYAWDKTTGNAGDYLTIAGNTDGDKTLSVNSVSASAMTPQLPTLSTINTLQVTDGDVQIITFSQLLSASNAADVDGTVTAFVVKEVTGGTLKIGVDANSATDFDATTNNAITAVKKAFWTPQGSGNAFTVVAKDNDGTESETPVAVRINSGLLVTTNLDTGDDATIGSDLATDLADGGGLSLREALNWTEAEGTIGFDANLNEQTISLATSADVKAGITLNVDVVGTLTITGSTLNLLGALNITNGTDDNLTISSVLAGENGNIVKNGVGTLTLSGSNSYEGTTLISAGIIAISSDANLGTDYVQIGETGVTVDENHPRSVLKIIGTGEQEFDNDIMIGASEGEVWVDEALTVTLNGKLDENPDDSGRDLVKTGLGTLILASTENEGTWDEEINGGDGGYIGGLSGDIFVDEGEVQVASDECLPRGEIYLPEGKDLEFTGEGDTEVNNTINLRGDNATIDAGSKTVTISGEIKGASTFNVKGNVVNGEPAGALIVSGNNNNFTGATNVSTGKLVINGSMANTASVTVGGTLGGSGEIGTEGSKGAVTVSSTGTLAPGNSPGQITLKNGLTLSAGAKLSIQLKTGTIDTTATPKVYGYDQVVVKGAVNITGSNLVLGLENNYNFNEGTVFKIIDNDSNDAVIGTFSGLSNGSTVTANGKYFTINYAGGDGNDVTLTSFTPTPTPEPTPAPQPTPTPIPVPTPAPAFEKPISKELELQVPPAKNTGVKGDGNGDGIPDVDQKNVISLPTQKDFADTKDAPKIFLSIELPHGQTLTKAEVKSVEEITKDKPITFTTETVDKKGNAIVVVDTPITQENAPFGLFEFNFSGVQLTFDTVTGATKGGTTDVKLYLDDKQTVEKYLKQTISGTWETIPFTSVYDEKLGKTVVSISLTDGDKFDLDGKVDGNISDPGTPIIAPKLTAAPVVELSIPTEKVFIGHGSAFELTSGSAQIFGSALREVLTLKSGASNVIIDQNVEQVNLAGNFADFIFEQQGNILKIINNSTIVAKVAVQEDGNGTLLGFGDGLRSASFSNATISVADKIVAADDVLLAILQKSDVYLAGVASNPLTVGSNLVNVYGSKVASDIVELSASTTNANIDANVEQVNFSGTFADYSFVPTGNSLNVLSGTTQVANIVIQDDGNGTTLNFENQAYSAHFVTTEIVPQIEITGVNATV